MEERAADRGRHPRSAFSFRIFLQYGVNTPHAIEVIDLGRMAYAPAFDEQRRRHERIVLARERSDPVVGTLLLVEHDPPVITISRRPEARTHLLASAEELARSGVTIEETDRGGDITYHGPGQLVAYPIFDLNTLGLNLHAYMRLLEQVVIDVCASFGLAAQRDAGATGVWASGRKVCAMGVRVRRWVTMHGLALNVTTDLKHFDLIVPCGIAGREVTSMARELGPRCPDMSEVKLRLAASLDAAGRALTRASDLSAHPR